jgi:hypothetical protein
MSEEWRVSLILGGRTGVPKKVVVDLRVRLGDDIAVSADKGRIFLYAGTSKAAEEAEYVARDVLTMQSLTAESRLELWDPAAQAWRDPRIEMPEGDQQPGRREARKKVLVDGVLQFLSDAPPF